MTKEEALLHNIPDNCIWEDKLDNCPQRFVFQAMEEFAKQEAILFGEWMKKACWSHDPYIVGGFVWRLKGDFLMMNPTVDNRDYMSEELFDLFTETRKSE